MVAAKPLKPLAHPTLKGSTRAITWLGKTASSCHRQGPAAADVADLGLTRVCSYPLGISSHGPITLNSQYFLPAQHRAAPLRDPADDT